MPTPDSPAPPPQAAAEPCAVAVEAGNVVVRTPGGAAFVLTPAAAVQTAERLFEAADHACRPPDEHPPPFPPAELVNPHAA